MVSEKRKHQHVVVGVIVNGHSQCVLSERRAGSAHAGCLEFPGGKSEPFEQAYDALCRELREELGICVEAAEPFMTLEHDYGSYAVTLDVWQVSAFSGDPKGCEGQHVFWQSIKDLDPNRFPAGNVTLVQALKESLCTS